MESARAHSLVSTSTTDSKLKKPHHTSNSLKLITSTSHSCARFTRSVSNASMITIIFTGVPLPLTHSRIIQAFSGTSQITVAMVAATEQIGLNYPLQCFGPGVARQCCRGPPVPLSMMWLMASLPRVSYSGTATREYV